MIRFLNFLLYQVGWFACVLGAAFAVPFLGAAIALVLVFVHVVLVDGRIRQVKLMTLAAALGFCVDTTLLSVGVYQFPSGVIIDGLPPPWMSVLWIQFATTTRFCLHWLSERYLLCSLLGLAGAPLAFLGGERLGAISFLPPRTGHLLVLGALWSVAIPALFYASDRIYSGTRSESTYRLRWQGNRAAGQ